MVPALAELVEHLKSLPGIGERTALRLALHLMKRPEESLRAFGDAITALSKLSYCPECGMVTADGLCPYCSDPRRDSTRICVVESIRDVLSIESTGDYKGLYHILGGVISPLDGIGPADLNISPLLERICSGSVSEVILAISRGLEGETTSFYVAKLIAPHNVEISAIARGVGFGDDLEYTDSVTLGRAIIARVPFKL
ncbi:MAG: recombination protein RecR [Bacteroidales bacterium]|nr:recombination protein RecR [Bacteroidales bacterium]